MVVRVFLPPKRVYFVQCYHDGNPFHQERACAYVLKKLFGVFKVCRRKTSDFVVTAAIVCVKVKVFILFQTRHFVVKF